MLLHNQQPLNQFNNLNNNIIQKSQVPNMICLSTRIGKNMGRNKQQVEPDEMPENLSELKPIVNEFVDRMRTLENEEVTLREAKKELVDEYATKLDTKTLKLALRLVDLKKKVQHKHYFDLFLEILSDDQ